MILVPGLPRSADKLDDNFWLEYLPYGSHEYACGVSSCSHMDHGLAQIHTIWDVGNALKIHSKI